MNTINILRAIVIMWAFDWLVSQYLGFHVAFAADGAALVQHELPELYEATSDVFPPEQVEGLYAQWTPADVAFFRDKTSFVYRETKQSQQPVASLRALQLKYFRPLLSVLGEIFGNQLARQIQGPDEEFIDETQYADLNQESKLHDGILVRREAGDLVVIAVIESKMGFTQFNRLQAGNEDSRNGQLGYLRAWQHRGMWLPPGSDGKSYYAPNEIYLEQNRIRSRTADRVKIADVGLDEIEKSTVLVGTESPANDFLGEYHQFTFNHELDDPIKWHKIRDLSNRFLRRLVQGKYENPVSSAQTRSPRTLDSLALSDYKVRLDQYIATYRHLPKQTVGSDGPLLARMISMRGGQAQVFIYDVSAEGKRLLTEARSIPVTHNLASKLLVANPVTDDGRINGQIVHSLNAFVEVYEADLDAHRLTELQRLPQLDYLPESTLKLWFHLPHSTRPSLIEVLLTRGRYWRQWRYVLDQLTTEELQRLSHSRKLNQGANSCTGAFIQ